VSTSNLANIQSVIIGVRADLGADVWLNGNQIDNQATLGTDDGGGVYWNRLLTPSMTTLIAGNNYIAARLNNAPQPSDGCSFDAEVGLMLTTGATTGTAPAIPPTKGGDGEDEDDGDDDSAALAAVIVLGVLLCIAIVVICVLARMVYARRQQPITA
jgi:hypothetical protein